MIHAAIIDTETTGIDASVDRICEIAGVHLHSNRQYSSLCNPGRDIPAEAMAIHHITERDVADAPTPAFATAELLKALEYPDYLIAHNMKFDWQFLLPLLPPDYRPTLLCTYRGALVQWPDAPRHTNQVLRYWLGLNPPVPADLAPHRALYDVIVTKEVFKALNIFLPLDKIEHATNNLVLLHKIPFGKHKGTPFADIDAGYIAWILRQSDMDEDVVYTARYHQNKRYRGAI